MIAGTPNQGGAAWAVLQYVLGLKRLGHDVRLIEPVEQPSETTRRYFADVADGFGLVGELLAEPRQLDAFDVALNISGLLPAESIASTPCRVYVDLDPAFNQLWQEGGINRGLEGHTHFVTVGQAIGTDSCDIPTLGRSWIPTAPPVVLEMWPQVNAPGGGAITTVANFRGYGSVERNGTHYGQKVHSLRSLWSLPRLTGDKFALAMTVHPGEHDDLEALKVNGWELVDPVAVAGTAAGYQRFIQSSRAEIGITKSGYVLSRCGWFSDRSACYLASGRPVVAQETGFSTFVPVGEGLFAFNDVGGAAEAFDAIREQPGRHARAAREIANEYFDSDRVLSRLLERLAS